MLVYHFTKSREGLNGILTERIIRLGRNVTDPKDVLRYAHVASHRFEPGDWTIQRASAVEAWILDIEIPDDHPLELDPTDEEEAECKGHWLVSRIPIPILKVHRIAYIPHVVAWETRDIVEEAWKHPLHH